MFESGKLLKLALCFALLGCSSPQQPSADISNAESGVDLGRTAFDAGEFELAEQHLSSAIDGGGLNPDLVVDAHFLRAECRIKLGMLDEAMSDVTAMEQGAPDLGRFHQLRGDILLAQGDKPAAKKAYTEARKINKDIQLPEGL